MTIVVAEEPMTALAEYALLPIALPVDQVLDVMPRARGGFALSARTLEVPYVKDYDVIGGEGPLHWSRRFDVSNWTLFTARVAQLRAVHHAAYPELPPEIQRLWYKNLRIEG